MSSNPPPMPPQELSIADLKAVKYCVGFPKMVPVVYTGQKDPIIIGSYEEVKNWLTKFWKDIYIK